MSYRSYVLALALVPALGIAPALGAEGGNQSGAKAPGSVADALIADARVLSSREYQAIRFRRIQTEFMVAGLSCRHIRFGRHYNAFVGKYRAELRRNARVLKRIFTRTYGRTAQKRLDGFVTGLANEAALKGATQADFCEASVRRIGGFMDAATLEAALRAP